MEPRDVLQIYAELDEELAKMDEPETPLSSTPGQPTLPSANARAEPRPDNSLETAIQPFSVTRYKSRNLCAKNYADYFTTARKKKMETN